MPVTAKLSRNFYERLGDDVAGELVDWFNAVDSTYQSQLREMNELNWERFKAELHAQGAAIRAELHAQGAAIRAELHAQGAAIRAEMTALRADMHAELVELGREMDARFARSEKEFRAEFADLRAEMMKWMFIYWTGSVVTLGGLMYALLNLKQ